jgi:Calcineurin-like phosphoesterase
MSEPKKLVVASDFHYPHYDPITQHNFDHFLSEFKPDILVINGDFLDFSPISHFDKHPAEPRSISDEILGGRDFLRRKAELVGPNCKRHFNAGNHEDRLRKYLWNRAPELSELEGVSLPSLLELEKSGYSYTPYYDPIHGSPDRSPGIDLDGLLVTHGTIARKWSGYSARAHYERYGGSGIHGHTHRIGSFYHRDYRGEYVWIEGGCMSYIDPNYVTVPDWCQGFTAGWIFPKGKKATARFDIHPVPIIHHKFVWEGIKYG